MSGNVFVEKRAAEAGGCIIGSVYVCGMMWFCGWVFWATRRMGCFIFHHLLGFTFSHAIFMCTPSHALWANARAHSHTLAGLNMLARFIRSTVFTNVFKIQSWNPSLSIQSLCCGICTCFMIFFLGMCLGLEPDWSALVSDRIDWI